MGSTDTTRSEGGRPARRTIVKGAAWAVPVVTVASAAPAMAVSPCEPTITFGGDSCKCPGQSTPNAFTYFLQFCAPVAEGCEAEPGTFVYITSVNTNTGGPTGTPMVPGPGVTLPIAVPVGACTPTTYQFSTTNSGNFIRVTVQGFDEPFLISSNVKDCDDCTGVTPASVEEPAVKLTVEDPATESEGTTVEEPLTESVEEPAPGADTESSTASQG